MFGIRCLFRGGLFALTLTLALGVSAPRAQPTGRLSSEQIRNIEADVAERRTVALSTVVREFTGALTQQNVHDQISSTLKEIMRQRIDFSWGTFRPVPVVILFEDPTGKDRIRMAIGVTAPTAPTALSVKAPLKLQKVQFQSAVRHVYMGPHEELGTVYRAIEESLQKVGAGQRASWPVVLQVLDEPTRFDSKQLRTVMNVPVK